MTLNNREAMAYVVFRETGCSRDMALKAVDELARIFRPIGRLAPKEWKTRRKRPAARTGEAGR